MLPNLFDALKKSLVVYRRSQQSSQSGSSAVRYNPATKTKNTMPGRAPGYASGAQPVGFRGVQGSAGAVQSQPAWAARVAQMLASTARNYPGAMAPGSAWSGVQAQPNLQGLQGNMSGGRVNYPSGPRGSLTPNLPVQMQNIPYYQPTIPQVTPNQQANQWLYQQAQAAQPFPLTPNAQANQWLANQGVTWQQYTNPPGGGGTYDYPDMLNRWGTLGGGGGYDQELYQPQYGGGGGGGYPGGSSAPTLPRWYQSLISWKYR